MMSLALQIARELRLRLGIMNPSDVVALRRGNIGMYWDGGHVALEEVMAVQTTILLHHRGVNPTLFTDKRLQLVGEPQLPYTETIGAAFI